MDSRGRGRGSGSRGRGGDRGNSRGRGGGGAPRMESPSYSESSVSSGFVARGRGGSGRISPTSSTGSFQPRGGRGGNFGGGGGRGGGPVQVYAPHNALASVDARLSESEIASLAKSLGKLSVGSRVIRPGFGNAGAKITLRANFFAVKYPKNTTLFDYAINITPEVKTTEKRTRRRIIQLVEQSREWAPYINCTANDGAQRMITKMRFPNEPFSTLITFIEEGETGPRPGAQVYSVEFENPNILKTSDLDSYLKGDAAQADYDFLPIVSAFNLITSQNSVRKGVSFGRNRYFFPPESFASRESFPLSNGVEAWKGFYSSVRPTYKQLMINVNFCMSAFFSPNDSLSNAILSFDRRSNGASPASLLFYGRVRVTTTHLGFKKRNKIKGFGEKSARETFFQCDEFNGKISVEKYFEKKYQIRLQHANDMPVVNIGGSKKDVFVPAEICQIEPGQPYLGKLSERETAEMIKFACNPPYINAEAITREGLPKLGLSPRAPPIDGFDVEISTDMSVVPARVLNPPKVVYKSGQPRVNDGSWNVLGVRFHRAATLADFAVLVLPDGDRDDFQGPQDLKPVIDGFVKKCAACGMRVELPAGSNGLPMLQIVQGRLKGASQRDPIRAEAISQVDAAIHKFPRRPQLIIVFLSNRDAHIYPGLKKLCDTKLGIPTVCVINSKIRKERGQDQYFSNIALKVNTKLGGVNHTLDPQSLNWLKDAMLVGMDVTHAGPGTVRGTPSIAAVVASCDNEFMIYPCSLRLQDRWGDDQAREMISDVKGMMIERLKVYQTKMKSLPKRIIVFRDGVSEGQFDQVLTLELPGLRSAIKSFPNYMPKITIAICGKRHHTRFYPMKTDDADRTGNTKAGTVVDQGVTGVYDFDYYLQAHAGLQGTVRSTHYSIIYDDNRFAADEIQQGTNSLSYLWARATKSVSLIPPAYWADLACERARLYLHEILPPKNPRDLKMTPEQIRKRAEELWGNGVHPNLKDTMFYL